MARLRIATAPSESSTVHYRSNRRSAVVAPLAASFHVDQIALSPVRSSPRVARFPDLVHPFGIAVNSHVASLAAAVLGLEPWQRLRAVDHEPAAAAEPVAADQGCARFGDAGRGVCEAAGGRRGGLRSDLG